MSNHTMRRSSKGTMSIHGCICTNCPPLGASDMISTRNRRGATVIVIEKGNGNNWAQIMCATRFCTAANPSPSTSLKIYDVSILSLPLRGLNRRLGYCWSCQSRVKLVGSSRKRWILWLNLDDDLLALLSPYLNSFFT
jgi:hypothetical protein